MNGKTDRNAELYADYLAGMTTLELSEKYQVSRRRVYTVIEIYKQKMLLKAARAEVCDV